LDESLKKKKKKKNKDDEDDIEADFEQNRLKEIIEEQEAQKKAEQTKLDDMLNNPKADVRKVKFSLPVKNQNGVLVQQVQHIDKNEPKVPVMSAAEKKKKRKREKKVTEEEQEEQEDIEENEPQAKRMKEAQEQKEEKASLQVILKDPLLRAKRVNKMKQEIAVLSTDILTEPVAHIAKLSTLYELCSDGDIIVKKMVILSLAALYKDLIPDYRINIELLSDTTTQLSKEVKELRYFELNLIKSYEKYVKFLERHAKRHKSELQFVCVKCMGDIFAHAPHFNFANTMIDTLVPLLNSDDDKIGVTAFDSICKLFENDPTHGDASLDIVDAIAKYVVKKNYDVRERTINCFLSLPLKTMLADKVLPVQFSSRRKSKKKDKKKELTEDQKLDKELKEAEGVQSHSQTKMIQTDLLRNVIVCYVRLLKTDPGSPLLFCSLAGLAKFAHLMNVDLLYDLLDYIKSILVGDEEEELQKDQTIDADEIGGKSCKLPVATILQSLITTARLMSGLGAAIDIDLKEFYNQLYQAIPRTLLSSPTATLEDKNPRLLVDALYLLLIKPNKLPLVRVASFVKRITTFALYSHVHITISFLEIVTELLIKYPNVKQLLSGEESGLGGYEPSSINPDHSNPFATSLWEISSLKGSYHARVQDLVSQIVNICGNTSKNQQSQLSATHKSLKITQYQKIITDFSPFSGKFNPPVKQPERNPTQIKYENMMKKRKEIQQEGASKTKNRKLMRHVYGTHSIYASQESDFVRNLRAKVLTSKYETPLAQILRSE
jgi:nucleolar complex protein 3